MKHTQRHFEGRIKSREKKTTPTCILRWLLNFMFGSFRFLCVYKCTYSMNHFYSHSDFFFVRIRFLSVCGDIKMNQFWWKKFGSSMKTSGCKPNDHKIHSCVVCAHSYINISFFGLVYVTFGSTEKNDCDKIDTAKQGKWKWFEAVFVLCVFFFSFKHATAAAVAAVAVLHAKSNSLLQFLCRLGYNLKQSVFWRFHSFKAIKFFAHFQYHFSLAAATASALSLYHFRLYHPQSSSRSLMHQPHPEYAMCKN